MENAALSRVKKAKNSLWDATEKVDASVDRTTKAQEKLEAARSKLKNAENQRAQKETALNETRAKVEALEAKILQEEQKKAEEAKKIESAKPINSTPVIHLESTPDLHLQEIKTSLRYLAEIHEEDCIDINKETGRPGAPYQRGWIASAWRWKTGSSHRDLEHLKTL